MKTYFLCLAFSCSLMACSKIEDLQEKKLDASKKQSLYEVKYGPKTRHTLNVCLPANRSTNTPVIIFIHGGAWLFGDKNVHDVEMSQFANQGVACATINYRFASSITQVRYAEMVQDVRLALDFIASKSDDWQVATDRFGLVGQSAGAHLALCTSYTANADNKIKAVVSWAGPVNLLDPDQLKITGGPMVAKNLVGADLKTKEDSLLYEAASPYYQIHVGIPPTLIIQGTNDIAVPYVSVIRFYSALQQEGEAHQMITYKEKGHLWSGETLDNARDKTIEWFKNHL